MKPSVLLAEVVLPNRVRMSLRRHDGHYQVRVGGEMLMSTTATASEAAAAEHALARVAPGSAPRVLIGGLGFGFTLKRALELGGPRARVTVVELVPQVVAWNREHLREVNGALLDDPRVEVVVDDVHAYVTRAEPRSFDAVILDVDNGPEALVDRRNARLYARTGIVALSIVLAKGGRAVFWSAGADAEFRARLVDAGYRVEAVKAKAYEQARAKAHVLYVADWDR